MLDRTNSPSEIRRRLLNPPNGRASSDLEIVSVSEVRRLAREKSEQERDLADDQARIRRRLDALAQAKQQKAAWAKAEDDWIKGLNARGVQIRSIIDYCCKKYEVKPLEILGLRRTADVCHARHTIAYLCCDLTKRSFPEIGRCLGGRDHTTIMHSNNKIKGMIAADPAFAAEIAEIKTALEAPV